IDTATGNFASFALTGAAGAQALALAPGVTTLSAGASLTVHIVGATTPGSGSFTATLSNTATVDASNEANHNQSASASEDVLSANVTISKTADAASVIAGGTAGFTVTL